MIRRKEVGRSLVNSKGERKAEGEVLKYNIRSMMDQEEGLN
jgi:hypothetical protein